MSARLKASFDAYAAFHRTPGNQACHLVGIPLIVLTLFALLSRLTLFRLGGYAVTPAEFLLAGALGYYVSLDLKLAARMLPIALVFLLLGRQFSWQLALALFLTGWGLQFAGHYVYEKKSPAFYSNLTHLLVGPLFILAGLTGFEPEA